MAVLTQAIASPARRPGQWWRRSRSNAAMIQDFMALKKCIGLCQSCESKMPWRWEGKYGYRLVHNARSEGCCDFCREHALCNLFHHVEEGYCKQWEEHAGIVSRALEQQIAIRDKRRIKGFDPRENR